MVISVWAWAKDQADVEVSMIFLMVYPIFCHTMLEPGARSSKTLVDDLFLIKIIWFMSIERGSDAGISIMQDVSRSRCVFYTSLYVCMSLYRCALYVFGRVVLN